MGVTTGVQWVGELIVVPIRDGLKSILFAGHIACRCLGYTEVTTCLPKKWEIVWDCRSVLYKGTPARGSCELSGTTVLIPMAREAGQNG